MAETFEAYRTRVLSYLGDEEPIGVQQATPSQLESRLRDVAPEELIRRPAAEKWSIAEIVAHLADAELAMGWRLRNMLANPVVALTWWDQAVWAERLGYALQDASLSAGVFRALRENNLRLLESVPLARWVECYGVHEVRGRQTVEEFVRLEAAHDLNHLRQIDRILHSRPGWGCSRIKGSTCSLGRGSLASRTCDLKVGALKSGHQKLSQNRGSLQMTEKRRNGFRRARKCFRMKVTPTVGV